MATASANFVPPLPQSLHVQSHKDSSHNVIISNLGSNNQTYIVPSPLQAEDKDELHGLFGTYLSTDALHDYTYSPPTCHSGTRTTVRKEIDNWIDNQANEKSPLLWLHAPAGVGKSVIAKTIAKSRSDLVVASFFFSTSSTKNATTLFPTLAWQLGQRIPDTKKHIIASLMQDKSLLTAEFEKQFDLLILKPLESITPLKPRPIMIIDGADECTDEGMLVKFLQVLVRAGEGGDMPVRFLICSRAERRIRNIMEKALFVSPTTTVPEPRFPAASLYQFLLRSLWEELRLKLRPPNHLHDDTPIQQRECFSKILQGGMELYRPVYLGADEGIPSSLDKHTGTLDIIHPHPVVSTIEIGFSEEAIHDIMIYLQDKFDAIRSPGDGTESNDILRLAELSGGQFLYASIIARLLEELNLDPRDISKIASSGELPTGDLNKLYKTILKRAQDAIRRRAEGGGPDFRTEQGFLMDSLALLVFFAAHVHFFTMPDNFSLIESLLGLERNELNRKLQKMHSVLNIKPGISVQVYHRSFLDFIQSRRRSEEYCISYSTSLRRVLLLMGRASFRYMFKPDDFGRRCIEDMAFVFYGKCFQRSGFSAALIMTLHFWALTVALFLVVLRYLHGPLVPSVLTVLWLFMGLLLWLFGTFTISLVTYSCFLDRSILIPFLHPFLHCLFCMTDGFLKPLRILFYALVTALVILGLSLLLQRF